MAHLYDVGTAVWQPDPTEGWIGSEVEERIVKGEKVKLVFRLANDEVEGPHHRPLACGGLLTAAV